MLIIPAIDIDGGAVARAGAAHGDPLEEAARLRSAGASWIHVVDMDRAFGRGDNSGIVRRLAAMEGIRVQLGGGLCAEAAIVEAVRWGVARVVVGPARVEHGLADLVTRVGAERLAAGIDVQGGQAYDRLRRRALETSPEGLADRARAAGISWAVYRDLERDGTLRGADLEGGAALQAAGVDVVVAGGLASLDEIRRAHALGLAGVLVGRALHAGRFTMEEAVTCSG